MASASATLVMGVRLDKMCEIRDVPGPKKYDQDTGEPVENLVQRVFIMGKEVTVDSYGPSGWYDELVPKNWHGKAGIYGCGDGSDCGGGTQYRNYQLNTFVFGIALAVTEDDHGEVVPVPSDLKSYEDKVMVLLGDLRHQMGLDPILHDLVPSLHLVCYYSY